MDVIEFFVSLLKEHLKNISKNNKRNSISSVKSWTIFSQKIYISWFFIPHFSFMSKELLWTWSLQPHWSSPKLHAPKWSFSCSCAFRILQVSEILPQFFSSKNLSPNFRRRMSAPWHKRTSPARPHPALACLLVFHIKKQQRKAEFPSQMLGTNSFEWLIQICSKMSHNLKKFNFPPQTKGDSHP